MAKKTSTCRESPSAAVPQHSRASGRSPHHCLADELHARNRPVWILGQEQTTETTLRTLARLLTGKRPRGGKTVALVLALQQFAQSIAIGDIDTPVEQKPPTRGACAQLDSA